MTLPDAKATATTPGPVTIPAGRSLVISFTFTPAQVQEERSSTDSVAVVVEHNTAPVTYDNKVIEFLPAPGK